MDELYLLTCQFFFFGISALILLFILYLGGALSRLKYLFLVNRTQNQNLKTGQSKSCLNNSLNNILNKHQTVKDQVLCYTKIVFDYFCLIYVFKNSCLSSGWILDKDFLEELCLNFGIHYSVSFFLGNHDCFRFSLSITCKFLLLKQFS